MGMPIWIKSNKMAINKINIELEQSNKIVIIM